MPEAPARFRAELAVPRRRRDTLRRPRLLATLHHALEDAHVLVNAPAGYGKTTLVVNWLDDEGSTPAWLTIAPQHLDPLTLLGDIAAALHTRAPRRLDAIVRRLRAGSRPLEATPLLVELLSVVSGLDGTVLLVVDDVHQLDGASESRALLDAMLRGAPPNLRLVLLSRTRPELAALPLAVARRELTVLDVRDLAFTEDEALGYLEAAGLESTEARHQVEARAGGWPAALAVLAQRRRAYGGGAEAGRPALEDEPLLDDFIAHEVLGGLDDGERALLDACAVIPHFDAELASELSGRGDASRALARLESRTQLLTRLGGERWYRMHSLLREHLLEALRRGDPARLRQLQRAGSAAIERRGEPRASLELALDAEDFERAAALCLQEHEALYRRGEWATLTGWLDRLPGELLRRERRLYLLRARIATKLQRPQESLALLDALDESELEQDARGPWLMHRATALRQTRRLEEALAVYRRARRTMQESEPAGSALLAELDLEEGIALGMSGQLDASRRTLEQAVAAAEAAGEPRLVAEAYQNLGTAFLYQGWLSRAMEAFNAAQRRWVVLAEPEGQLVTLNNIATAQHLLGEFDGARRTFDEIAERALALGIPRLCGFGQLGAADIERDRGDLDAAEPLYLGALERARAVDHGGLEAAATYGLAMVQRERGDLERARALLEQGYRLAEQQGALELRARLRGGIGAVLLSQGRPEDAVALLEQVVQEASAAHARRQEALALLWLASAQHASNAESAALGTLTTLRNLVEALGYDHFLVTEARLARPLLDYAASQPDGEYFARLIERTGRPTRIGEHAASQSAAAPVGWVARAFGVATVSKPGVASEDVEWRSGRSKELFVYLLHLDGPVTREQIALALWPDVALERVSSLFHSTLYRLRQAAGNDAVLRTREGYRLNPALRVSYDARNFEALLDQAASAGDDEQRAARLRAAVACYRGPFGETFASDWTETPRARYEARYLEALLALARLAVAQGRYVEAIGCCESVLETDPLNEEAVRDLIAAHVGNGHPDLAARAYQRLQDRMAEDLAEEPSIATRRVLEKLVAGAAARVGAL